MSDGQGDNTWKTLGESAIRWLLAALVSVWVFIGTVYALVQLDTWAYGHRPDRSGDLFLYFCMSILSAIVSAWIVAWLARPNKANGTGVFSGSTGRLAGCATIALGILIVFVVAIAIATKF
jgi:hypothetical protein